MKGGHRNANIAYSACALPKTWQRGLCGERHAGVRRLGPWLLTMCCATFAIVGGADSDAVAKEKPAAPKVKPSARPKAAAKPPVKTKKPPKSRSAKKKHADKETGGQRRRPAPQRDERSPRPALLSIEARVITCPSDMVAVAGRVCVDRYETSLVDLTTGARWAPFYPPDLTRALETFTTYQERQLHAPPTSLEAQMPLPPAPSWSPKPKAVSTAGVIPQGYLTADQAANACSAAGKRLCTEAEWLTACRGEAQQDFPYGTSYEQGACNVYRENHPSAMLHANSSKYHDDPRNNLVEYQGKSLAMKTGSYNRCASRWGDDAIFDMVGNLDEWVDDAKGVFVGGFYSRGTKLGCMSRIDAHPRRYSDYSTGTRCCADPSAAP